MAIFIPNDQPLSQINATVSGGPGILLFETLNDFDALIALCAESKGLGLSNIGRWLPGFDDWVSWFRDNPARDAPRRSEFIDATELKHPNNLTLLEGFEHAILRVIQEALTNVYRHSGAKNASVLIEAREGEARVIISDDGTEGRQANEGIGIPSMRSRVAEFGGTLNIASGSHGTRVLATLPLPQSPDASR